MIRIKTHPILFLLFLELIFFQTINASVVENSKIENVLSAFKEVAYSYYMRGKKFSIIPIKKVCFPQKKQLLKA